MSNLPAVASSIDDADMMVGMEDFDVSDIILPTITIEHSKGLFKDSLSGETFTELNCVILGLVKGRVMWDKEVKEDEPPLCQSLNFEEGRPGEKFPWAASGFQKDITLPEGAQQVIKCDACPLKEWGTHPTRDTPWCAETHTYVIGLPSADGTSYAPAVITFKSSGITPSRAYLSSFARAKTPTFTCHTKITLNQQKRGSVEYCTPSFTKGEPVDSSYYSDFVAQYRMTRDFLQAPRSAKSEGITETQVQAPAPRNVDPDEMPF